LPFSSLFPPSAPVDAQIYSKTKWFFLFRFLDGKFPPLLSLFFLLPVSPPFFSAVINSSLFDDGNNRKMEDRQKIIAPSSPPSSCFHRFAIPQASKLRCKSFPTFISLQLFRLKSSCFSPSFPFFFPPFLFCCSQSPVYQIIIEALAPL